MRIAASFQLHPEAAHDIKEICEFIAEDSIPAASRVREEILEAIRGLVAFPHKGRLRPELNHRGLRFIVVRDYLIAYASDETPLMVIAVIHGRRNPRTMSRILNERT